MSFARHRSGPRATLRAVLSQVHPVFMLPPIALSALGTVLAGGVAPAAGVLHAAAIFCAVYTAHVKDGYVDFHVRGEDDDHPLTVRGCRFALVGATGGFFACVTALWALAGPAAALLVTPTWLLGYLHAPYLDMRPVMTTLGYPAGSTLALVSAVYTQAGTLDVLSVALAAVLLVLLTGIKIIDDMQDYTYDKSIGKRTVAVALGVDRGRRLGFGLLGLGLGLTAALAVLEVFPAGTIIAVFALGAVAALAVDHPPETATMLLVRGSYVYLAVLLAAIWFQPLSGTPPLDIGVLGGYTYLATELVFGVVAFVLLQRASALREAARTIAVIYPVAYVWDWYTLRVGVFSIPLRTGISVLEIPLEEHLFIVVVPAFVLGVHATVRKEPRPKSR